MKLLYFFYGSLFWHIDRLADSTRQEWLYSTHHFNVPKIVNSILSNCTSEHIVMFFFESWRTHHRTIIVNVINNLSNVCLAVTERLKRTWHRLVHDRHRTP